MMFLFSLKSGYPLLCIALTVSLLSVYCVVILHQLFCGVGFLKLQEAELPC